MEDIRQADVCFVVDTTSSMSGFIGDAKRRIRAMLEILSTSRKVDLRASFVEFRDYPPQDRSFVTKVTKFTANLDEINETIRRMQPAGGGDMPEAVYAAVQDAAEIADWRDNSIKLIVLVGDAPPHAMNAHDLGGEKEGRQLPPDVWSNGISKSAATAANRVPSDLHTCTAAVEEAGAIVYAMCVSSQTVTLSAFTEICSLTGGEAYGNQSIGVMETIQAVLDLQIDEIDLQEKVMAAMAELNTQDLGVISEHLGIDRSTTSKGYYGLRSRGYE